jgi:cytochrome c5
MDPRDDRTFLRQFSGVITGFVILTVALIFLARFMQPDSESDAGSGKAVLAEKRIAPVGAVRSGDEGAAELAEAQAAAAPAAAEEPAVVDGAAVYGGLCKTCHEAGVAGAPIAGSDQMAARLEEKGMETLLHNALNGLNAMPPRGGNPTLTDDQIKAAIEFMLP